ncbi:YceD family protein [Arthrobacter roseus]|uniref:YceD family protein n=1 Tax=Arthrobacter roseus TaxID=136274 RepID=UPI00196253AC|nr:YceD family protein [Arthrobacter roseus]
MVFNVKDLGRSPGSMRTLEEQVSAPGDLGVALIGVQEGSPVDLELRLEAVHEGILVSGSAFVHVAGQCGRCLEPITYTLDAKVQELFYYADTEVFEGEEQEDQHRIENGTIDLEPVLRDAVVTTLPFQPVCQEDCQGLCSECGVRLMDNPDHHHEVLDPRWAALAGLTGSSDVEDAFAASTESDKREES